MRKCFILIFILLCFSFAPQVSAEEIDINDIYDSQFKASGADKLEDALPDDVKEQLEKFDISSSDFSFSESLNPKSAFGGILNFFKSGFKAPLAAGCSVLAILLFGAAVGGLATENKALKYAITIGITVVAALPAVASINATVQAVKAAGVFMLAFIPVFAALLISGGKALTAAGFSSIMLACTEAISALCSFVLVPLTGMQLALGIGAAVMPDINTLSISKAIKKASGWTLTLASTVLLGLLGMQTIISGSADNLYSKTAKFIVGTAVPVVGTAVSEAIGTVKGCLKLLSSSVMIYGVVALALIMLPVLAELMIWRVTMLACSSVAEVLSQSKAAELLKAVDSAIAFILGILVLIFVLFVISLTIVSLV